MYFSFYNKLRHVSKYHCDYRGFPVPPMVPRPFPHEGPHPMFGMVRIIYNV